MEYPTLTAIVGPTAVGKTALAVAMARRVGGEIVSADFAADLPADGYRDG